MSGIQRFLDDRLTGAREGEWERHRVTSFQGEKERLHREDDREGDDDDRRQDCQGAGGSERERAREAAAAIVI